MEKFSPDLDTLRRQRLVCEARTLLQQNQVSQAVDKFRAALRGLSPRDPLYLTTCAELSQAYRRQGNVGKAIRILRKVVRESPENPLYRLQLAYLYRDNGQLKAAAREARMARKLDPEILEADILLAEILVEKDEIGKALVILLDILERHPRHPQALDLLATVYLSLGEPETALDILDELTQMMPSDPSPLFKRAVVLHQLGSLPLAMEALLRLLMVAPQSDLAQQAREIVALLDEYQLHQIIMLAQDDALFRAKLLQDPEEAIEERGFLLSPEGLNTLLQIDIRALCDPYTQAQDYHMPA